MFAVYYSNGSTGYSGFTDGKLINDGSIFVVAIWNDDNNHKYCIFVNADSVFPKYSE